MRVDEHARLLPLLRSFLLCVMEALERLAAAHARLKRRVHAFRAPIRSRWGLFAVGCLYFTVPSVVGYFVMQWSNGVRDRNLGAEGRRERLVALRDAAGSPPRPDR